MTYFLMVSAGRHFLDRPDVIRRPSPIAGVRHAHSGTTGLAEQSTDQAGSLSTDDRPSLPVQFGVFCSALIQFTSRHHLRYPIGDDYG
jgi:hypothetical protein